MPVRLLLPLPLPRARTPRAIAAIRSPDDAKIKSKMLFASSKDALRRSLVGIAAEIQGTDFSEVAHESGTSPRASDVLRSVLNGAPSVRVCFCGSRPTLLGPTVLDKVSRGGH